MPPTCSICRHSHRKQIEELLIARTPLRRIAAAHGTTATSIIRHRKHVGSAIACAIQAKEVELGNGLLLDLDQLRERARGLLEKAEASNDWRTALLAIRELTRLCELRGLASGELSRKELGEKGIRPIFNIARFVSVTVDHVVNDEPRNVTPHDTTSSDMTHDGTGPR
jgi:hypothetical protein